MKSVFIAFVVLSLFGAAVSSPATTLTVTNSANSGEGTLRHAILDADADGSPDHVTIGFNIPGAGVQTHCTAFAVAGSVNPKKPAGFSVLETSSLAANSLKEQL